MLICRELRENALARIGHKRCEQNRTYADSLKEIVEYRSETLAAALVLCEHPRGSLIYILICTAEESENGLRCIRYMIAVHLLARAGNGVAHGSAQLVVYRLRRVRYLNDTAEILTRHVNRALYKVAEIVCKVGVISADKALIGDAAVGCVGHLGKHIVAHAVNGKVTREVVGIQNIAL